MSPDAGFILAAVLFGFVMFTRLDLDARSLPDSAAWRFAVENFVKRIVDDVGLGVHLCSARCGRGSSGSGEQATRRYIAADHSYGHQPLLSRSARPCRSRDGGAGDLAAPAGEEGLGLLAEGRQGFEWLRFGRVGAGRRSNITEH
jgi:hypothetical protein